MREPIGMIINGGSTVLGPTYDIVDLRDDEHLFCSDLASKEMAPVIAELNLRNSAGEYEDDFDLIRKHAATLCRCGTIAENTPTLEEFVGPVAPTAVVAAEITPDNTTENSSSMPSWSPPKTTMYAPPPMTALPTLH